MEEDINKLEKLIDRCKQCKFASCEQCEISWAEVQSIGNLLARNKELEENNKLLIQGKFREVANKNKYIKEMYIPKSKVKEKAEDLEKRGYFEEAIVLQELIED